jgi:hypothetical protein
MWNHCWAMTAKYETIQLPLLDNGSNRYERNDSKATTALQQRGCIFYAVRAKILKNRTRWGSVSQWRVGWWVRRLLRFSRCELLLWETVGIAREPRGRGTSAVESRYQGTASGDCNRLRALVCVWHWFVNYSHELCVKVFNKSDYQTKRRIESLYHVTYKVVKYSVYPRISFQISICFSLAGMANMLWP